MAALADAVDAHRDVARVPQRAMERAAHQVRRAIAGLATRRAERLAAWGPTIEAVAERRLDPVSAAERLSRPG
jgi:hypothetical protein